MNLWRFSPRPKGQSQAYMEPGRLEDVLALIQVLGLDHHAHRIEKVLQEEMGTPQSARTWMAVAKAHPEFFRVSAGKEGDWASLVARHALGTGEQGREFSRALIGDMIDAAIKIHDSQLRRRQVLNATWLAGWLLVVPALASIAASVATIVDVVRKK